MLFFKNSSTNISLAALRIIGIEAYLFNIGFKFIAGNLDLSTFTALRAVLTGNTTLTASNTPASGESFVRSLTISSTASETLTLPVSWNVFGTYQANTNLHDIQIEFSNFPTEGLVVKAFINELT